MSGCTHEQFEADVNVVRLLDGREGGEVCHFVAEVAVRCAGCGADFGFRGVECGASITGSPMRSVDALELRVPLLTPSELVLAARDGLAGLTAP